MSLEKPKSYDKNLIVDKDAENIEKSNKQLIQAINK